MAAGCLEVKEKVGGLTCVTFCVGCGQGSLELSVGWTGTAPVYPGLLYASEQAGQPPALTEDELLFAYLQPEPVNRVGALYYPGMRIVQGATASGSPPAASLSAGVAAFCCAVLGLLARRRSA